MVNQLFNMYSGAYDDEEAAAHAYDLAALKYWGQDTILNFPVSSLSLFSLINLFICSALTLIDSSNVKANENYLLICCSYQLTKRN